MSFEEPPPGLEEQAIQAQNKAAFLMDLRARGIQDLGLMRALEFLLREIFVQNSFADLARRAIARAGVVFGDGMASLPGIGSFERVIVHGLLSEVPENLIATLGEEGLLVAARPDPKTMTRQRIARIARNGGAGI